MIDKITFYIEDVDIYELEKKLRKEGGLDVVGIDWVRSVSKYGCYLKDKNIFIKINGATNKLQGYGSLHKFAKGNNYSTFTAQESINTIKDIGELMGIALDRFIITCIEIGVNMPMTKDPMRYIDMVHSYGRKTKRKFIYMRPLKKNSKLKGKLCQFTEYAIKFYDKTFEAGYPLSKEQKEIISSNILRYEIELHPKQYYMIDTKHNKASTLTAKELLEPHYYARFAKILEEVFERTELRDLGKNHEGKSLEEIKNYIFVMSDGYNLYRNYIKEYRLDEKESAKEYKDIKKLKRFLEKEFEPLKETENVLELKSKFAVAINIVHDTEKIDTGKKEIDISWLSLILEN